ncbi:hypothetical protein BH09MYX1_BH09MYX1_52260 [soil metagenome]
MSQSRPNLAASIATGVSLLSSALWLGGILVLGAIVAPIVLTEVPAPTSADAMTHVFLRFDRVAPFSLVVIGISEAIAGRLAPPRRRVEQVRLVAVAIAGALALVQALWLSPTISDLHQQGAIRGLGPLGLALEVAHHRSELCGKSEVALLAAFVVLSAFRRTRNDAT